MMAPDEKTNKVILAHPEENMNVDEMFLPGTKTDRWTERQMDRETITSTELKTDHMSEKLS